MAIEIKYNIILNLVIGDKDDYYKEGAAHQHCTVLPPCPLVPFAWRQFWECSVHFFRGPCMVPAIVYVWILQTKYGYWDKVQHHIDFSDRRQDDYYKQGAAHQHCTVLPPCPLLPFAWRQFREWSVHFFRGPFMVPAIVYVWILWTKHGYWDKVQQHIDFSNRRKDDYYKQGAAHHHCTVLPPCPLAPLVCTASV